MFYYGYIVYICYSLFLCMPCRAQTDIKIDTHAIIHETDKKFIGVTIDSGVIRRHWEKFDPTSTKVKTLSSALAPCYIRFGGTDADFLIFDDSSQTLSGPARGASTREKQVNVSHFDPNVAGTSYSGHQESVWRDLKRSKRDVGMYWNMTKDFTNFTMSAAMYDQLYEYVSSVGWDLIFDLNVLLRQNGNWDPTNALKLMKYTVNKGYSVAGWELGNEPDDIPGLLNITYLTPTQLVKDYQTLVRILEGFGQFRDQILGPSVCQLSVGFRIQYFSRFLDSGGGKIVTAASFHQYYVNGRVATLEQFCDPKVLNFLYNETEAGMKMKIKSGTKAQLWIGETSSAWGGGALGLSDRYVAAFMWLDKLGIAARTGVDVVLRQSFYGGHYALIDSQTLDPNPDYWLTLLYKLLVGPKVLNVKAPNGTGTVRAYAHCAATDRSGYSAGSVVVYVLNLNKYNVSVRLPDFSPYQVLHVYRMEAQGGDLVSQTVLLNGVPLKMVDDHTLPNLLQPVKIPGTQPVNIPARTYAYIVLPQADVSVCK